MARLLLDNSIDNDALLFEAPVRLIVAHTADAVLPALEQIETALAAGHHVAGYMAYEIGHCFEPCLKKKLTHDNKLPLLWFGVFDKPKRLTGAALSEWLTHDETAALTNFTPRMDEAAYTSCFHKVKKHIYDGDVYQINLTFKVDFAYTGSPRALYNRLRLQQPVEHAAFIETDDWQVLSASPERFIDMARGKLTTTPMKGTIRRGRWHDEDGTLKTFLTQDEKSRAENAMIVDLMRNDVGRIAKVGSVYVDNMFDVKSFPSLHQMTTDVHAELREDISVADFVQNLWAAGSITGAPKIRAQEIIADVETSPRDVYTGTIGYFAPEADGKFAAHFNVAIRTLTLFPDGTGDVGIGSGVVYDSNAADEYKECLLKMRFLQSPLPDFYLFETILWQADTQQFTYLTEHLQRLKTSALRFGFDYDEQKIKTALAAATHTHDVCLRLVLHKNGEIDITEKPLPQPAQNWRFCIADTPMDSGNLFLFHKTSIRTPYDTAREKYLPAMDEVVFVNERGEVTEGTYTNLFIEKNGKLLTPALKCGLLPGTLRAHVLKKGQAEEAVLTVNDLAQADAIYLGNSVRGMIKADLVHQEFIKSAHIA